VGGAGDLAPSTKTLIEGGGDFEPGGYGGRNLRFGVREHGMAGAANGMALSGLRPYVGTFLTFSDYMRPSIRLAALMDQPVTYVFTHDSIGLGEDGPTHQPIEQLPALRAIPNLSVIRPCDANETVQAWRMAMGRRGPTALVLSRQALPTLDRTRFADARGLARGAYVLSESGGGEPRLILIGAGSEVRLCLEAQERLRDEGVRARVVSMPSFDLFEAQDEDYRHQVLPPRISARVAVEAAAPLGWDRYVGPTGAVIAMHGFGTSAPGKDAMAAFGFTVEAVCAAAKAQLERRS
jgi:transketolase